MLLQIGKQSENQFHICRVQKQKVLHLCITAKQKYLHHHITPLVEDIPDRVIMYEFTPLIKQLIGRPHRRLQPKDLQIRILVTRETEEVDFFLKYIYARSQLFHHLLRIDYTEVLHLGNMLLQERSATK